LGLCARESLAKDRFATVPRERVTGECVHEAEVSRPHRNGF
jgi:hypothetical protein